MLPALQFRSLLPALAPHLGVVGVVALLAQGREVQQARRFRPVVKHMRRGQHHFAARYWVRLAILRAAPLAAVLRSEETHEPAPQLPVRRVARFVLGAYRHGSSNSTVNADCAKRSRLLPRYAPSSIARGWRLVTLGVRRQFSLVPAVPIFTMSSASPPSCSQR